MLGKSGQSRRDPIGIDRTIAIHHLDKVRAIQRQSRKTRIAGTGGGKGLAQIQRHHLDTRHRRGHGGRAIGRSAVDVNHPANLALQRSQARRQPRAFVAPDDDGIHSEIWRGDGQSSAFGMGLIQF